MAFFKENLNKLENENAEHMPIGFEVAFPSLLDMARGLKIEVQDNSPILNKIFTMRNVKLTRLVVVIIMLARPMSILIIESKQPYLTTLFLWESIYIVHMSHFFTSSANKLLTCIPLL